jgi:nucleotide-binding universal stress UspA family protein
VATDNQSHAERLSGVLARVVVGLEDTPDGLEAARQAAALQGEGGSLHLVAAAEVGKAVHAGFSGPALSRQMLVAAEYGLRRAERDLPWATTLLVKGPPAKALLESIGTYRATLVSVGVNRMGRAVGMMLGDVASVVLRDAPCSVFVARGETDPGDRPARIVVGVDGSPHSEAAFQVAQALSERFGASLRAITGLGGKQVDPASVSRAFPASRVVPDSPVDALVAASHDADLVVVGSRGLHGLRALGSVSERVAHRAGCSVLVVRERAGRLPTATA